MKQDLWKIRVAFLWLSLAVNYTALLFIEAANGGFTFPTNDNASQYVIAAYYSVILVIGLASVLAKPRVTRWLIVVVAFLFLMLTMISVIGVAGPKSPAMLINEFVGALLASLIIWCGWKCPR